MVRRGRGGGAEIDLKKRGEIWGPFVAASLPTYTCPPFQFCQNFDFLCPRRTAQQVHGYKIGTCRRHLRKPVRAADMGQCCGCMPRCTCLDVFSCVDGVPCYGKDEALIDNDANDGETNNKKQSGWCVDDSATERVFIPDGKRASAHIAAVHPCVVLGSELHCLERGMSRIGSAAERDRDRNKRQRERRAHAHARSNT